MQHHEITPINRDSVYGGNDRQDERDKKMEFSGFQLIVMDGLGVTINDNAKIAKKRTLRYKLAENYTILTRLFHLRFGHIPGKMCYFIVVSVWTWRRFNL